MKIFVGRAIHDAGLIQLREAGHEVAINDGAPLSPAQLREAVQGCDAIISVPPDRIDDALLDAAHLKVVQNYSVGVDNIDLEACARRGVPVGNTPDVLTDATADVAWALLMAAAWRVVEADAFVRAGDWKGWEPRGYWGADFAGATLGIVGFGRIGQAVARRAQGFGMNVIYWNRSDRNEQAKSLGATRTELDELLARSDFVSVHCALSDDTRGLIGARGLGLMKPSAILVNTARGAVIDQSALATALKTHAIRGAGLDVFTQEPLPLTDELVSLSNVVLTPHYGSATERTRARMSELCALNVLAALRGEALPHPV